MESQRFIAGTIPKRFVDVDAAGLLLILDRFAPSIDERARQTTCLPDHEVTRPFTPEYPLQKLDFLDRYPGYLAYELTGLHRLGIEAACNRGDIMRLIRTVCADEDSSS